MPQFFVTPQPIFQPGMRLIASITNAPLAVVTTTINHLYISGTIIRLDIPTYIGMQQANGAVVAIKVLGPTSFSINLDTTSFDPFIIPFPLPATAATTALCVPIGEVNSQLLAATNNYLPFAAT